MIHKAIRGQFARLVIQAGKTTYTETTEVVGLYENTLKLQSFLRNHARREDEILHPVLRELKFPEMGRLDKEHAQSDEEICRLVDIIAKINADCLRGTKDSLPEKGDDFYLSLSDYTSMYFRHMHHEETRIMSFLWSKKTDNEIMALHRAMQASITSKEALDTIPEMFPYVTTEQAAMLTSILNKVFPSSFLQIAHSIRDTMGSEATNLIFMLAHVEFPRSDEPEDTYAVTAATLGTSR